MSFWDIFTGDNKTLDKDISGTGANASFASATGMKDVSAASDFYNGILSGNQQKIGQVLAPQIGQIQKQTQQQKQTVGEFGDRSGGTGATMASIDDTAHGHINDLIGDLTKTAVSGDASLGSSMLSEGTAAYGQEANLSQDRLKNMIESIFGKATAEGISGLESFGIGKL